MKRFIKNFSYGMDSLTDVRNLPPNGENDTVGGSPYAENVSITKNGALVTATGYEVVSSIASTGGASAIIDYNKDTDYRYLLIVHDDDIYSITPSSTTWDNTNLGDYGTAATDVGGCIFNGNGVAASGSITITSYADLAASGNQDTIRIKDTIFIAQSGEATRGDATFRCATSNEATARSLCTQINNYGGLIHRVNATVSGAVVTITAKIVGEEANGYLLEYVNNTGSVGLSVSGGTLSGGTSSRVAIVGSQGNATKICSISAAMSDSTSMPGSGFVNAIWQNRLFIAHDKTLYYSEVGNENKQEGAIAFNDIITALIVEGTRMVVFTRSYNQGIYFQYDTNFNISLPLKEAYERLYGNLSYNSVHIKDANTIYFAKEGIFQLGAEENYDEQGVPRPMSLSTKIDPSLKYVNYNYASRICSIYDALNNESLIATPYESAQYCNKVFVYNWNHGAWTFRTGLYPTDFAYFKASTDYRDTIYLTDHFNSRLLRLNNEYSYGGDGYTRKWKSKVFTMESDTNVKEWRYIFLNGSMYITSEFYVKLIVDGKSETFKVDKEALVVEEGGYLGDNWLGDEVLGGTPTGESGFYRFKNKIKFPSTIRYGYEMQIEIYNSEAQQPWKINGIEIDFEFMPEKRLPSKYINNNLLP